MARLVSPRGRPGKALIVAADVAIVLASIYIVYLVEHGEGLPVNIHEEAFILGVVALLVIISVHLSSVIQLPPAVLEVIMGAALAEAGADPGEALIIIAGIGVNMLMLLAGSEVDVKLMKLLVHKSALLALIIFVPPLVIGYSFGYLVGASRESSLLIAAALAPTSVALTYSILQSARALRITMGQLALTAAMISDVGGIVLLTISTASINPLILLYGGVIVLALMIHPLLPKFRGGPFESEVRLIVMAVIVLGVLSDILGVHSILTSFILGLLISETVRSRTVLKEKLESIALGVFTPFFFIVSGMYVSLTDILGSLPWAVAISALVISAKLAFSYRYFRAGSGLGKRTSAILSLSLVPLLSVTIIAAAVGLELGFIDKRIYSALLGTVIITNLVSGAASIIRER